MANLRETRQKLRGVAIVLLVVDIAAAAVLLSPLAGAEAARQQEFESVRQEVQSRLKTVIPSDKVQERVGEAGKQIDTFYDDRIPSVMSAISQQLGTVASQAGVRLLTVKYQNKDAELPELQQILINATLEGDYLQDVKFINEMERQKLFFIVDGITLGESGTGQVRLQVTLETYLRGNGGA